jgi:hypothetical protein
VQALAQLETLDHLGPLLLVVDLVVDLPMSTVLDLRVARVQDLAQGLARVALETRLQLAVLVVAPQVSIAMVVHLQLQDKGREAAQDLATDF